MKNQTKFATMFAMPVIFFAVLWAVSWRRRHPPATAEDLKIEALLRRADKAEVRCEFSFAQGGAFLILDEIKNEQWKPLIDSFRLDGSAVSTRRPKNPYVWIVFTRANRTLVECLTSIDGDETVFFDPTATSKARDFQFKSLHWTTALQFGNFMKSRPRLRREFESSGCL